MNTLCGTISAYLESGTPLVLVTLMDQKGSAPRTAGARMIVFPDGSLLGTVGGGRYEAEAISAALELHRQGASGQCRKARPGLVLSYSLQGVTDMDMICGGTLNLLLEYLPANDPLLREAFALGKEEEALGRAYSFAVCFAAAERIPGSMGFADSGTGPAGESIPAGPLAVRVERFAFGGEDRMAPQGDIPRTILSALASLPGNMPVRIPGDGKDWLLERFLQPHRLFLFGAGHVSLETARLANTVDFSVVVVDDRPEYANEQRFPGARVELSAGLGPEDSAALLSRMAVEPADAIVILTRGHAHDRDVLGAALQTRAGYIGMIGSKGKRNAVYKALEADGIPRERLNSVHSPIGLPIGAETPAEIAVSIVGELIRWRSGAPAAESL